jgi:hypothetical protein
MGGYLGVNHQNAPARLQVTVIVRGFSKKVVIVSNILASVASILVEAVEVKASRGEF